MHNPSAAESNNEKLLESYYVIEQHVGWAVQFDSQCFGNEYATLERALEAAGDAAEARWRMTGFPTSVQVRARSGLVTMAAGFGIDVSGL